MKKEVREHFRFERKLATLKYAKEWNEPPRVFRRLGLLSQATIA